MPQWVSSVCPRRVMRLVSLMRCRLGKIDLAAFTKISVWGDEFTRPQTGGQARWTRSLGHHVFAAGRSRHPRSSVVTARQLTNQRVVRPSPYQRAVALWVAAKTGADPAGIAEVTIGYGGDETSSLRIRYLDLGREKRYMLGLTPARFAEECVALLSEPSCWETWALL